MCGNHTLVGLLWFWVYLAFFKDVSDQDVVDIMFGVLAMVVRLIEAQVPEGMIVREYIG